MNSKENWERVWKATKEKDYEDASTFLFSEMTNHLGIHLNEEVGFQVDPSALILLSALIGSYEKLPYGERIPTPEIPYIQKLLTVLKDIGIAEQNP